MYVCFWQEGWAASMHDDVYWVGDALVYCIKVDPMLLWDKRTPQVQPRIRVLHPGA